MDGGVISSKVCNGCKVEKPLTDYHLRADRKDGRRTKCRLCENETKAAWKRKSRKERGDVWRSRNNEYNKRLGKRLLDRRKKLYAENKERYREYAKKAYYKDHEKSKFLGNRKNFRRKERRADKGNYTYHELKKIRILQKHKCAICKTCVKRKFHIDHITPLIKGGRNEAKNLQILCPPCNQKKSYKDPIDYMRERGFLL